MAAPLKFRNVLAILLLFPAVPGSVAGAEFAEPAAGRGLVSQGFLDITAAPFHADPTGQSDATRAIQNAVVYAREHQLVTFFPPGTYRVSDTIECIQTRHDPVTHEVLRARKGRDWPCILGGSRRGKARPKIVLAPNSSGFGDPEHRKYVIHFWARAVDEGGYDDPQPNISMNQMFIGIDVTIGPGNPGAVAIRHRAAQGSGVEDCTIDATYGYSGLEGGAGSGGSHANVTIIGGRIGVDLRETQPAPTITGFTLRGQTETALLCSSRQALTAVGLRIETDTAGPAIVTRQPQGPHHGQLCLVDSVIDFHRPGKNTAIDAGAAVFLDNVYLHGAETIVRSAGEPKLSIIGGPWNRVPEFALAVDPPVTRKWQSKEPIQYHTAIFLDGKRQAGMKFGGAEPSGPPPDDLQSRHIWDDRFPSRETPTAVNVCAAPYRAAGDGTTDDVDALQRAIDEHDLVFLPKGTYRISRTLTLRPRTKLLGAGRCYSWIEPLAAPKSDFANAASPQPVVRTADDANARTVLAFLGIRIPNDVTNAWCLHWQSGQRSIFRDVNIERRFWVSPQRAQPRLFKEPLVLIDGHGGGRWYNFHQESWHGQDRDYRHLLVQDTSQPLAFYQCNVEHARGDANMELRGAHHVSLYSVKGEYNAPIVWIRDCDDVRLFGYGGNAAAFPGQPLFRVERTPSFLVANLMDSPRLRGGSPEFFAGEGVDPHRWHILEEVLPDGRVLKTSPLDRPVLYQRGDPSGAEANRATANREAEDRPPAR